MDITNIKAIYLGPSNYKQFIFRTVYCIVVVSLILYTYVNLNTHQLYRIDLTSADWDIQTWVWSFWPFPMAKTKHCVEIANVRKLPWNWGLVDHLVSIPS